MKKEEITRYSRQILLPEIRKAGQEKLNRAHVFVVGAGGLGSPVLLYLAAAGVGKISFADGDRLDLTNLQRQVLYKTADLEKPKASSALHHLKELNPHINLNPIHDEVTPANALTMLESADLVIETTDNFESKFLINDACYLLKKPLITGGILRFEGQVISVLPGNSACYRCIFIEPPPPGQVPNCSQAGVFGAVAGIVGSMQAAEALKILTEVGAPLAGKMIICNILTSEYRTIKLPRNPSCPLCSKQATITELREEGYRRADSC